VSVCTAPSKAAAQSSVLYAAIIVDDSPVVTDAPVKLAAITPLSENCTTGPDVGLILNDILLSPLLSKLAEY
jgi:hypothetical protein